MRVRLLLMSGGLDSSALAADLSPRLCLTVDYGQRPAVGEIRASAAIAVALKLRHEVLRVDLSALGSGDMAGRDASELASGPEWWPYRNQMLITLAAMRYVADGLSEIVIGSVGTDTHADGKAPFLDSIDRTLFVQEGEVRVSAPARDTDPVELLRRSALPRELLGLTFSCHSVPYSCGRAGDARSGWRPSRRFDPRRADEAVAIGPGRSLRIQPIRMAGVPAHLRPDRAPRRLREVPLSGIWTALAGSSSNGA